MFFAVIENIHATKTKQTTHGNKYRDIIINGKVYLNFHFNIFN